ncbi:MAG TPA: hypothetical protein VHX63_15435 [Acidobacteriaceae bacterium]|jgi:hypothetical protein|nr:hypothetical protein [Acidobacteriaceae bacterium]
MAWTERYVCDVCGKKKTESEDWWLALIDCHSAQDGTPSQPVLKLQPWNNLVAHSAETKHLCGAACMHKFLDRWMGNLQSIGGPPVCNEDSPK